MFHNHHSPALRIVGQISWLLTAVAAIAWGLIALGVTLDKKLNIWESDFVVRNLPWLVLPGQYIIGVCGVISLIMWILCLGHGHDERNHHGHDHAKKH